MAKKRKQRQEQGDGHIWNFAIYKSPEDYPGQMVGRMWKVSNSGVHPMKDCTVMPDCTDESLEELRKIPREMGMIRIPRERDDDENILEVWI